MRSLLRSREPRLYADESEAGGGDRERSDDEAKVADAKTNCVDVEAQRSLAGGKERGAEAGNRRQPRRFLANRSVDQTDAASSAAIETPTTTPSPIRPGAKDNPPRPIDPTTPGGRTIVSAARW